MSKPTTSEFILLFRGRLEDGGQGRLRTGHPLGDKRVTVSGRNRVFTNGPFAGSKETIGGCFLLNIASMDEAVAIAQQAPGLPHGIRVELRPVAPECPINAELNAAAVATHT